MLKLCQVFSPEQMNGMLAILFAVSAGFESKDRIWINLSAVRTCLHSGSKGGFRKSTVIGLLVHDS